MALSTDTTWGIFDSSGNSLFQSLSLTLISSSTRLSTASVEYHKEARVSDFPVEQGSFASYNKVETGANPVVVLCLSGSDSDRTTFFNTLETAVKSTDLYSIITPEITYIDYTLERYNYSRKNDRGATLITVEIALKQIRQVSAQYSNSTINAPQDPGATPSVDSGNVQGATATTATQTQSQSLLSQYFGN
jgi:hypothetical protein